MARAAFAFLLLLQAGRPESPAPAGGDERLKAAIGLLKAGKAAAAIENLRQAVLDYPSDTRLPIYLAMAQLEWRNDAPAAVKTLEDALARRPGDVGVQSLLANVETTDAQRLWKLGRDASAEVRVRAAKANYEAALAAHPIPRIEAAAWLGLGSALQLEAELFRYQGKHASAGQALTEAAAAYRRAQDLDPALAKDVRALEIDLALPPPRSPGAYSEDHFSVTLAERLRRLRSTVTSKP
jgi:tetratricopeptide (TPR) repeat protein